MKTIRYIDLDSGEQHEESVYGGFWVRMLYGTWLGQLFSTLVALPFVSRFYGWLQDRPASAAKVAPFIRNFNIDMRDFLHQEGQPPEEPYASFNHFFTRRLTDNARPFARGSQFPAPCDARYFAYNELNADIDIPVKGSLFTAPVLLAHDAWAETFLGGAGFIARLCPVDYHRFHFPDDGTVLDRWRIPGALHSVNPWALAFRGDIFMINEREVTILDTEHFGKIAFVDVGATCVGKIKQTYSGKNFHRGEEKGMFLFGGSTVIVLGEPGRWQINPEILSNTRDGIETYVKMGRSIGSATS